MPYDTNHGGASIIVEGGAVQVHRIYYDTVRTVYGTVSLYRIESRKRFDSNRISSKALIGWLIGFPGTKATGPNTICEQPAAAATQITVTAVKPELVVGTASNSVL